MLSLIVNFPNVLLIYIKSISHIDSYKTNQCTSNKYDDKYIDEYNKVDAAREGVRLYLTAVANSMRNKVKVLEEEYKKRDMTEEQKLDELLDDSKILYELCK